MLFGIGLAGLAGARWSKRSI
ncbi:MAG: hypothetical protein M3Z35_00345 [Nitrospirota bacterium]|nr:hypothetical protein [Nitrospirota bacterium]